MWYRWYVRFERHLRDHDRHDDDLHADHDHGGADHHDHVDVEIVTE